MKFRFRAHYNDGSTLTEDPTKEFANYSNINRHKLVMFELFNIENNQPVLKIKIDPGQRLIWRRRKAIEPGGDEKTVHIVGKQQTINGKNYQGIALLYDDGTSEFFDKFNPKHPWLHPVILTDQEKATGEYSK